MTAPLACRHDAIHSAYPHLCHQAIHTRCGYRAGYVAGARESSVSHAKTRSGRAMAGFDAHSRPRTRMCPRSHWRGHDQRRPSQCTRALASLIHNVVDTRSTPAVDEIRLPRASMTTAVCGNENARHRAGRLDMREAAIAQDVMRSQNPLTPSMKVLDLGEWRRAFSLVNVASNCSRMSRCSAVRLTGVSTTTLQ